MCLGMVPQRPCESQTSFSSDMMATTGIFCGGNVGSHGTILVAALLLHLQECDIFLGAVVCFVFGVGGGQDLFLFLDMLRDRNGSRPRTVDLWVRRAQLMGDGECPALRRIHRIETKNTAAEQVNAGIAAVGHIGLVGGTRGLRDFAFAVLNLTSTVSNGTESGAVASSASTEDSASVTFCCRSKEWTRPTTRAGS